MALQQSGRISLNDIKEEFGGSGALKLSQYYRGGARVPNTPKNQSISTNGRIAHSMFYGASKELSAKEIIDLANASKTNFYRMGAPSQSFVSSDIPPVSWWGNGNWPSHKFGAGVFNYTWNFSNLGFEPTEDKCVVVLSQGGRPHSAPSISSVYSSIRGYVGFREIFRSPGYNRASVSAYEVDCDRREVASVVSYHSGDGRSSGSDGACYILPGGGWQRVNFIENISPGTHSIYTGDFVAIASGHQTDNTQSTGIGWSYYTGCGNHWYGGGFLAAAYGVVDGAWSSGNSNLFSIYTNSKALYLRKVQEGDDLTRYRNVIINNPQYATISYQYQTTSGWGKNSSVVWVTGYFTIVYFLTPTGSASNNAVQIISYSTTPGGYTANLTAIQGYGNVIQFSGNKGNYTATVTVENSVGERHTFSFTGSIS